MRQGRNSVLMLYSALTRLATPLAGSLISLRTRRGKEDPTRRRERFGHPSVKRPSGPLIWVHAASVGEAAAILPLIEMILAHNPSLRILATTTTITSARIMTRRLPRGAVHQFVPLDTPRFVKRFLKHWQPDLVIFAESEIWPNILRETNASGAQLALVNARISQRSFLRWQRALQTIGSLLRQFDLCLAQSAADMDRLMSLGAENVANTGNIKFDVPAPQADPSDLNLFLEGVGDRPRWAAISTHSGEEESVAEVHQTLAMKQSGLITILAPRHPERGAEIASMLNARGLRVQRRSVSPHPMPGTDIFILDTIGDLGVVFRSVDVVFMGGSLVRHGGQNPIEPAKLGCAIIYGPHVSNFTEVYAALEAGGGAEMVRGPIQLAQVLNMLLENPAKAAFRAGAADEALRDYTGALDRTYHALMPLIANAIARYTPVAGTTAQSPEQAHPHPESNDDAAA